MSQFQLRSSPPRANPREFDFSKKYGQISDGAGETHCQIPNGAGKNIVKCPYLPRTFPIILHEENQLDFKCFSKTH
jgi:hypothetical protein